MTPSQATGPRERLLGPGGQRFLDRGQHPGPRVAGVDNQQDLVGAAAQRGFRQEFHAVRVLGIGPVLGLTGDQTQLIPVLLSMPRPDDDRRTVPALLAPGPLPVTYGIPYLVPYRITHHLGLVAETRQQVRDVVQLIPRTNQWGKYRLFVVLHHDPQHRALDRELRLLSHRSRPAPRRPPATAPSPSSPAVPPPRSSPGTGRGRADR